MTSLLRGLDSVARVRLLLGALGTILAAYLSAADKPWSVAIAPGKSPTLAQYVTIYFWIAAAANLILTIGLGLTAGWWMKPVTTRPVSRPKSPAWFWPLVGFAMALNAFLAWPQLTQSLWHDEAYPIRRSIVGHYEKRADGSLSFDPVKWRETLFYFKKPNHVLHSIICRVFNDTWRLFARPKGLQFSEAAVRLPSLLAGVTGVATIALLVRRLGFPSAGTIAAFLFALHPWQIRYAGEARAYALVLALLPLLLYLAIEAIAKARWRWWLAFAGAEFALLYAYPTCIYILAILNVAVPIAIACSERPALEKWNLSGRWLVANILAGMAFLQMMLPCIPQFLAYIETTSGLGDVNYQWTQDFLSHLLAGIPWSYSRNIISPYIELYPWAVYHPGLMAAIAFVAVTAVSLGMRRLALSGLFPALLIAVFLLPATVSYAVMRTTSGHMYVWYIIFVLPGVVILAALGIDDVLCAARNRLGKIVAVAGVILLLSAYAGWTAPQRSSLMNRSMQPNRESVLLTRPVLDPNDPRQKEILTATFFGEPFPYDPNMIIFRTMPRFAELIRQADSEQKPLFVNLGYLVTVEGEHPHKYRFLKDSGLFDDLGILRGHESMLSRHVFRYRPGSAAGFDFESVLPDRGSPGHDEE